MRVTVAYALPEEQYETALELPDTACVADALNGVAGQPPFSELDLEAATVGVFNRVVSDRSRPLREGDRVEIYRDLRLDPMTARKLRADAQRR